ncbi:unnamed protein product, partial [Brenthis ino]
MSKPSLTLKRHPHLRAQVNLRYIKRNLGSRSVWRHMRMQITAACGRASSLPQPHRSPSPPSHSRWVNVNRKDKERLNSGAEGRVPTIVGFDLTRLPCESFIYSRTPRRVRIRSAAITIIPHTH